MTELAPCPVEDCDETVNYTDLIDHLYAQHDAMDLCATVANLVADLEHAKSRAWRYRISWRHARTRAISTSSAADRYGNPTVDAEELAEALGLDEGAR